MNAVGAGFPKWKSILFLRQSLFVKRMACFMDTAPGHVTEVVFINPCCNTYIPGTEACTKGMFADILSSCFKIKIQLPDKVHTPVPLDVLRERLAEEAVINLGGGADLFQELAQAGKESAEGFIEQRYGAAFFVLVEQGIVRMLLVTKEFCLLFFQPDQLV